MLPKMSGYVKTFKDKVGDKHKKNNNKLMSFRIDDDKLLGKYKTILFKTEDLQSIEMNALEVYDKRYIKIKIRTYKNKVYTSFRGLNVPKDSVEYEPFTIVSIKFILVYKNKHYLQGYLDNCAYKL